ncbi:MerR family transcriptional regulator [Nocardia sp. CDC159]|uniref:MerR family transcriptional regulator n=1 Tax=Nocardia pulmonis TaxID=2951408 RepID=A0A9X2EE00_9NOCA|nr:MULTISPECIES: MerR family transcriptional regulator [Nocardia]MCM6778595.1 MerR family transcriptional regulator [Nocardia pulmonis]MCM6791484.1 MerR family transcriptional regulator [Nocardia sp. CDC159]
MLIGELADRSGTSARMLRYYEQQGLVRARRSASGYRVYDEDELRIVHKIRALRELGFELADVGPFVTCLRAGHRSGDECPDSVQTLRRRLTEVDDAIDELGAVRRQLRRRLADAQTERQAPPACELTQHLPDAHPKECL